MAPGLAMPGFTGTAPAAITPGDRQTDPSSNAKKNIRAKEPLEAPGAGLPRNAGLDRFGDLAVRGFGPLVMGLRGCWFVGPTMIMLSNVISLFGNKF